MGHDVTEATAPPAGPSAAPGPIVPRGATLRNLAAVTALAQVLVGFRIGRLAISLLVILMGGFVTLQLKGGPTTSSDGAFSLTVPSGWQRVTNPQPDQAGITVLMLAAPAARGIEPHVIVEQYKYFVSLNAFVDNWQATQFTGNLAGKGSAGVPTVTTIATVQALQADFTAAGAEGQMFIVDYQGKTYFVAMTSDPGRFETFRNGDFAKILASWHWSNPPPQ